MRALLLALLLVACATPLSAQEVRSSPELLAVEVARQAGQQNWEAVANLTDPVELERLRATFGRLLQLDPDPASLQLFGVADVAGFLALDPRSILTTFLRIGSADAFGVEFVASTLLGVVREEPDMAHAVLRQDLRFEGRALSTAELISMRRGRDGWWARTGPEMQGMLLGMESQFPAITE
ncbi:MAG TPA: hypothetical protein VMN78_12190 [Longimicrobiales bacterium]|nr:hypothetical protein [Longimicrobiales bacterium]